MTRAYIGLLSARGDSPGNLRDGLDRLRRIGSLLKNSDLYRSASEVATQANCYAMAARLDTVLDEPELAAALETVQMHAAADRESETELELSLTLLGYGDSARSGLNEKLSAFRSYERACVLEALAEIDPDLRPTENGVTAAQLSCEQAPGEARVCTERVTGTSQLGPREDLDYDTIGEAGANYQSLRPLSKLNLVLFEAAANAMGLCPGMRVLEVGCGTGRFCTLFAQRGAKVIGLDRSANMLAAAQKERTGAPGSIEYVRGDANEAVPGGPCDAIAFFFSIQYMSLDAGFWQRLREALAPRGVLVVATFPHRHFVETEHARFFPSIPRIDMARFPSVPKVRAQLREHGFCDIAVQDIVTREEESTADLILRTQARYLSTFHLLSEPEFERGLLAMRAAYAGMPVATRAVQAVVISARARDRAR